ncbi:hypothetical protein VCV18_008640 [Metarhizium anisopliae]
MSDLPLLMALLDALMRNHSSPPAGSFFFTSMAMVTVGYQYAWSKAISPSFGGWLPSRWRYASGMRAAAASATNPREMLVKGSPFAQRSQ